MHELPVIRSILDIVLKSTPPGSRVLRIDLLLGAYCDAEPLWLQRYLDIAAKGSPAQGATLKVERGGADFEYRVERIEVKDGE